LQRSSVSQPAPWRPGYAEHAPTSAAEQASSAIISHGKAIQELLGHATIEMTMRYPHLSPHVPRDAVKLLDHGGRLGNGWAKPRNRI
jgi:integrase